MRKQALYGKEARDKILEGVKKICAAVKVTLGVAGRNVLICQSMVVDYGVHSLPIYLTKDGFNVTKHFDLDDPFEKAGVLMIKEAAQKTVTQAGDGTTTTCVLAEAIVTEGIKLIDAGANPMELKRGIDKAVEYVVAQLKEMATPIAGDVEKIRQIATVSANNDSSIGDLIAEAFAKIGSEGVIDIEASRGVKTEIKIAEGIKFGKGWVSPLFVNKQDKQTFEIEDVYILLYENRILHNKQIQRALELIVQASKPLLIICEDADQQALGTLAMNVYNGRLQCCVVSAPDFGDLRQQSMDDIALMTGGTHISSIRGIDLEKDIQMGHFGRAKKVVVSKDETVIIGGFGDMDDVAELVSDLRLNLESAKDEDEKYPIEKRIAKLTGGVAVIQVGAATETEMKERLDRFDDSVRATKAAISEGFVVGGGTAFMRLSKAVAFGRWPAAMDENRGFGIVLDALNYPLKQMCLNAGVDAEEIGGKVFKAQGNIGYNVKTDKIEDLVESGIIDPTKALRCALQNAASSAGLILTTECLIVDTL